MKQLPTEKDLWLNDLGILNLLSFEAKYVILQQEWTDVLKIGRYMTAEVRCIIEDKCDSLKKYKKILKGRTLLHQGKQVLSNDQIWDVIRNVKEPKSTREVRVYLSMKLWNGAKFELYKDRSAALNNFADFSHQALNFDRLWLSFIALITTEKSREYFPQEVKGTAGRDSTNQKGMM